MTLEELKTGLQNSIGIPITYAAFQIHEELPYMVLISRGEKTIFAWDNPYITVENVDIELYTENKDIILEKKIKDYLLENKILYDKNADEIDKNFLKTTFEIEI